jgi:AcrR family transcriptional regulator
MGVMPKNDGEQTRQKILQIAEQLFADQGFHGTSVAEIAKAADVNKALIYYYFKDKNDIIMSLFRQIVADLAVHVEATVEVDSVLTATERTRHKLESELRYLAGRRRILTVMLMEALKGANLDDFLFQCAEIVIRQEVGRVVDSGNTEARQRFWVTEFFTGFMPMISFVVFNQKFSEYFACDPEQAVAYFLDVFERSHLNLDHDNGAS